MQRTEVGRQNQIFAMAKRCHRAASERSVAVIKPSLLYFAAFCSSVVSISTARSEQATRMEPVVPRGGHTSTDLTGVGAPQSQKRNHRVVIVVLTHDCQQEESVTRTCGPRRRSQ